MKLFPVFLVLVFCYSVLVGTNIDKEAEQILKNPELESYHGWLKYLDYRIEDSLARLRPEDLDTVKWIDQKQTWVEKISDNPETLRTIRGTQEWAYLSEADDSGQPFQFATPLNYDPSKSYGLLIYAHGYSGNHMEHMLEMPSIKGNFRISVLGRARGGQYHNLSENDVMMVIRYMLDHWNIDPKRVHMSGGSMGGWASFYLPNRYPHQFASTRPTCGYALNLPVENWLHVPFYATHSKDDPVVPVVLSRVPLKALKELGGQVVIDETDGLGHQAWNYQEGNARGEAWWQDYRAPEFKDVRRIDYTATDGKARQGYWATIETWGPEHRPARMQLTIAGNNELYVQLHNVKTLSIDVPNSPVNNERELKVSLNGRPSVKVNAPIPEKLFFTTSDEGNLLITESDPWEDNDAIVKHYPGGARNLYNGQPLLVVWGTRGTPEQNAAMLHAATAAMRSPHPAWTSDEGDRGSDTAIHEHMTYSRLKGKADVDVTPEDLQTNHLVIIGCKSLNSVAAELSEKLPVEIGNQKVTCSDGVSWEVQDPLVFFTHYNPAQKDRLLYWVSTENIEFLNEGWETTSYINNPSGGIDLAVLNAKSHVLSASRVLDSHWRWSEGYKTSPLIPLSIANKEGWYATLKQAFLSATGADAAIVSWPEVVPDPILAGGKTRFADVNPFVYGQRLAVMELSGPEMKDLSLLFSNIQSFRGDARLFVNNAVWETCDDPGRTYKVVMTLDAAWAMVAAGRFEPESLHYVDPGVWDALTSYLRRN